jgi:Flp pilus assembly protein TadG
MKIRSERGAAVVEFAVILPLLLLIIFGIVEFGFIFYNKAMLTNASREGARRAIVYQNDSDGNRVVPGLAVENAVAQQLYSDFPTKSNLRLVTFGTTSLTINPNSADGDIPTAQGSYVTVRVDFDYDFLLIPSFIPGISSTIKLSGITTMRAE